MEDCCQHEKTAAARHEEACCGACPDNGCEGCACAKPQNTTGCCMGDACGCGNR